MRGRVVVIALLTLPLALGLLCCTGIVRPPRPMFHNDYFANDRSFFPMWYPTTPCADEHGHWTWADFEDNLLVVQATGTAERGRSQAMAAGTQRARFRLGSGWDDERDNQHAIIARMRDALVVILPDGQWERFSLGPGLAREFHRQWVAEPPANLLREAGTLLSAEERARLGKFLAAYKEPAPVVDQER